ncbi:EAL domain-containing protein [Paraburkholderia solisilvae]|uniref:cyclic-guanylate-specific phosphodiesterase n=1 Tax=Paraburkholderia solisilvae TaxID=624376 RepID=A0A6J5E571_9BURK|nr:EAL domain-containing protein [Paraburkholderia solisilvae]CAB3761638.1 putative cyclic di-GMP phosphodiesterase PdeB [Paraburkholderia solisilvae]
MSRLSVTSAYIALTCVATLAPVLTSVYAARENALARAQRDLQQFAGNAIIRSELVSYQAFTAVADIERIPGDKCSAEHADALRRIAFSYRYVQDAGAYGGGIYRCSALLEDVAIQRRALPEPDWRSADGFLVWFHQKVPLDVARETLVIGRNGSYVSVDPQSYVDVIDPAGRPIAVVNVDAGKVFAVSSGGDADEMLDAWRRAGKVDNTDWLYAVAHSSTRPLGVVVKSHRPRIFGEWSTLLAGWLSAGIVVGATLGWLSLRLLSHERSLPARLERAIRRGQIDVHYQPVIRLRDRVCIGVEALARWRLDGRMIAPDQFVPVAEERGLIQPLTDLVLKKALQDLGALLRANSAFHVSLNVGAADLQTDRFLRVLGGALAGSGIRAHQVCIEATERSFLDAEATRQTIAAFRGAGHPVHIDDFGTGYSSLAYLQNFRVDVLKIDKSFIDKIAHDAASSIVAPHIIAMAHALGVEIVAEGIEHESQADYLRQRGVQYGQGWLFAKALSAGALAEYLRAQAANADAPRAPATTA